jgi:ribosomal protein L21E
MRALPEIQSQIKRYLPEGGDHVHIQVNPANVEGKLGS